MACALFSQSEKRPEGGALDLSRKPPECNMNCQCLSCIFTRFNVPVAARNILIQQWPKQNLHHASLPAFNFDQNANQFNSNGEKESLKETRRGSDPPLTLFNKLCRNPEPVPVPLRQSPQGLAHHYNDYVVKSPQSPTSSTGSSPVNGCYRAPAFPGANPDAFLPEPFKPTTFSPHFPMGVVSPTQLSLNAWWTLHPATSPSTTKSSPERTTIGDEPGEVLRSRSVSPAARSLSSQDSHKTTDQTTATPKDKDTLYMQKRLKNNLAAKRSRDMRRQREDRIAANCRRMHNVLKRVKQVRTGYLRLLVANSLDVSQAIYTGV